MKYDLTSLVKGTGARRPFIAIPAMHLQAYWEVQLLQICLTPVKVWEVERMNIVKSYEAMVSEFTADAAQDQTEALLVTIEQQAATAIVTALPKLQEWLAELTSRHARRWASFVKSHTKVDPWPYIDVAANRSRISVYQERMTSLIRSINEQARKDVSEVVWKGVVDRTPPRAIGKAIAERLSVARSRANFIASDQANKVHALLNQIRQEEAGLDEFMWETAKDSRVRPTHAAQQGKVFKYSKPPSIGLPATEPRCRCTARAYIDLS